MENLDASQCEESQNNNKLLNAIRNKFAASEGQARSIGGDIDNLMKFDIPELKNTQPLGTAVANDTSNKINSNATTYNTAMSPLTLNNFLRSQLGCATEMANDSNGTNNSVGFSLPQLGSGGSSICVGGLTIPMLRKNSKNVIATEEATSITLDPTISNSSSIEPYAGITSSDSSLLQSHSHNEATIDLRIALHSNGATMGTPGTPSAIKRRITNLHPTVLDFEIPFIECDTIGGTLLMDTQDDDCSTMMNLMHKRFKHTLTSSTAFGRVICLRYQVSTELRNLFVDYMLTKRCGFKPKHKLEKFRFDTKSPDDKVQESLQRSLRRI